jgi:hypothetical protein
MDESEEEEEEELPTIPSANGWFCSYTFLQRMKFI